MGRAARDWFISLSCIASIVILSVVPLGGGEGTPLVGYILDAGHFFFYALCALLIYRHFPVPQIDGGKRLVITVLIGSLLSGFLETVQPSYGRSASISDFIASSSGTLFGALCPFPIGSYLVRAIHLLGSVLVGVVCLKPAIMEWKNLEYQRSIFPDLATFKDDREFSWWSGAPVNYSEDKTPVLNPVTLSHFGTETSSKMHLRVTVNRLPWRGAVLRLPARSWENYKQLNISLMVPKGCSLRLRIDDELESEDPEDRFATTLQLNSGWNEIIISIDDIKRGPANRKLELSRPHRLYLYSTPESAVDSFVIGPIGLS